MSDPNFRFDDEPRFEGCAGITLAAHGLVWFVVGFLSGLAAAIGMPR